MNNGTRIPCASAHTPASLYFTEKRHRWSPCELHAAQGGTLTRGSIVGQPPVWGTQLKRRHSCNLALPSAAGFAGRRGQPRERSEINARRRDAARVVRAMAHANQVRSAAVPTGFMGALAVAVLSRAHRRAAAAWEPGSAPAVGSRSQSQVRRRRSSRQIQARGAAGA